MSSIDDMKTTFNAGSTTEKKIMEIQKQQQGIQEQKKNVEPPKEKKLTFKKQSQTVEEKARDTHLIKLAKEGDGTPMKRREKKMIENREFEGTKMRNNLILGFAVIALFFIMFLYYYMKMDWMFIIIMLLGSMMFLPVGMVLGWAFLDPYVRCKILRKMTHRNYGIINFVGKGQKLISKIKNFEQSLVWKKNEVWVISEEFVYQLSKDGDSIVEKARIAPENIVTLIDTVPVMFVDVDCMQPLILTRDKRMTINPLELGATLKAWVDNQLAKSMFLKKTYDVYFLIVIIASIGAIGFGYVNYTKMDDISNQLKTITGQLDSLLSRYPIM